MTGIEASMISRMLKPEKPMLVDELVTVCEALRLDAGKIIDEGRRQAQELDGYGVPRAHHSTTVTREDIAAGASLPLGAPPHRRSTSSSDTRSRRHSH